MKRASKKNSKKKSNNMPTAGILGSIGAGITNGSQQQLAASNTGSGWAMQQAAAAQQQAILTQQQQMQNALNQQNVFNTQQWQLGQATGIGQVFIPANSGINTGISTGIGGILQHQGQVFQYTPPGLPPFQFTPELYILFKGYSDKERKIYLAGMLNHTYYPMNQNQKDQYVTDTLIALESLLRLEHEASFKENFEKEIFSEDK